MRKYIKKTASYTKGKVSFLKAQFRDHASTAIIAALGFVIAISWKDLIIKVIKTTTNLEVLEKYPYIAELYTAIIVTFVAIFGIAIIGRWAQKAEE